MTALARNRVDHLLDGQGEELLPVATFGAQVFVFAALLHSFKVTGFGLIPPSASYGLLFGALGVLFLAPRRVLMRLPISGLALLMMTWIVASLLWTDSSAATVFAIGEQLPILVGMIICIGLISMKDLVPSLLWFFRFSIGLTMLVTIVMPETRMHFDEVTGAPSIDGWHGLFPHKNLMTPFLVLGILTVLTFDRNRVLRYGTVGVALVLLAGSASVTGMAAAMLAVSIWVWMQLYQNLDIRNSSIFLISSISVGLFAILGFAASLATLTSASGRDLTFTGRTLIWAASLDAIRDQPITGFGFGGVLVLDPTQPPTMRSAEIWRAIGFRVPHAHSGPIDLALQLGVVGLAIFLALYVVTLTNAVGKVREQPKIGAWIVSVMVVQLFMSFSENVFMGTGWLPMLFMFRSLLDRRHGMELDTGRTLADRVRETMQVRRW
ncbi:MAG: O-antigen ligase family protein [Actinomycetota bacterium]